MRRTKLVYFLIFTLAALFILNGCSNQQVTSKTEPVKKAEVVKKTTEPVKKAVKKVQERPARVGRYGLSPVGDTRASQIYADDFYELSEKNKNLSYYLYLAGLAGIDMYWDQMHKHSLKIRDLCEGIYKNSENVDPAVFDKIKTYTHRLWLNSCQYNLSNKAKFIPDCTYEEFVKAAKAAQKYGAIFSLNDGETLQQRLEMLKPYMFDKDFEPMVTAKNPPEGEDILTYSSNNFYEGVTNAEVLEWSGAGNEKYPLNSKVMKENGKIVEKVYRAGDKAMGIPPGMYAKELGLAIKYLEKACEYAEPEQCKVLEALIKYYKTGDPKDFDDYNILWLQNDPTVDFMHSFVENYMDSRGQKGAYECYVYYKEFASVKFMKDVSDLAAYFEQKAPFLEKYKKQPHEFGDPPVANNVILISGTGDGGPGTPAAFNLPNAQWIREKYGSKNVMLRNSMGGNVKGVTYTPREPSPFQKEFLHPKELEFLKTLNGNTGYTRVTLHEIIGHGSGKTPDVEGDPSIPLGEFYNTLEECRADLMAYWNLHDPKLQEVGAIPNKIAADGVFHNIAQSCVTYSLNYPRGTKTIEQDHQRGRFMMRNYLWKKCKAVQVDEFEGKLKATPVSVEKMVEGVGQLLAEIMRIKATGDYKAAKELVETYGIYIDQEMHGKLWDWFDKYRAAQRAKQPQQQRQTAGTRINHGGVTMPILVPVKDRAGKITDIKVEHWHDFAKEMLYYSSKVWKE